MVKKVKNIDTRYKKNFANLAPTANIISKGITIMIIIKCFSILALSVLAKILAKLPANASKIRDLKIRVEGFLEALINFSTPAS